MKVLDASGQAKVAQADFIPFIPRARVRRSAAQAVAANTRTILTWDVEDYDTASLHDPSVNTSRLTISQSGLYWVGGQFDVTAGGRFSAEILKNGTQVVATDLSTAQSEGSLRFGDYFECTAGDYFEARIYNRSVSVGLTVENAAEGDTFFEAILVGPGFNAVHSAKQVYYVTPVQFASLSPIDGDEAYVTVDATNGIIWHVRYNAGSSSAYKWEWLGGTPLISEVLTAETPGSFAAFVDLATVGPSVTIPRSGQYFARCSYCTFKGASGGGFYDVAVKLGSAATSANEGIHTYRQSVGAGEADGAGEGFDVAQRTAVAGDVWKMQYQDEGSVHQNYQYRRMIVQPVRIS